MNILMVIEGLRKGGKERRLVELLKGLAKDENIRCEIVSLSTIVQYDEIYDIGYKIHLLKRKPKKDPRIFPKLYRICKRFKPDIIHSWGGMASVYAIPVARLMGIKMINAMVTSAPANLKKFSLDWLYARLSFPFSDIILGNSHAGLKAYSAPVRKSFCLHNGFDFNRLKRISPADEIRKEFNITTTKVVGMVATFSNYKDYDTYFIAAKKVIETYKDVSFLAIGGGPNYDHYYDQWHKFKNIRFLGSQKNVESIVNIFDIGVLSTYTEGISNSIMEYMVLEKPVVATDGGGTNEIIKESESGFLISQESPDKMAEKILFLLENDKMAEKMGKAGRRIIEKDFNLNKMTSSHLNIYYKFLK